MKGRGDANKEITKLLKPFKQSKPETISEMCADPYNCDTCYTPQKMPRQKEVVKNMQRTAQSRIKKPKQSPHRIDRVINEFQNRALSMKVDKEASVNLTYNEMIPRVAEKLGKQRKVNESP